MDLDNAKNTVSKQAVIENVCMMLRNCFNASDEMIESVKITVGELPPSPSRQAAIDADGLDEEIRCEMCENPMHTDRGCDGNCKYDEILYEKIIQILNKRITQLPSAQPEQLTDKEQRIFLAAMEREEKVCKQVDDECRNCREPYEDSLVRTCHEITRKVKDALWT